MEATLPATGEATAATAATAVAEAAADASVAKGKSKNKRTPLRRPRGKRGGVKNQKKPKSSTSTAITSPAAKETPTATPSAHSLLIAAFHALEKKLAQTSDEAERAKLIAEREKLGGLKAYQDASLVGVDKHKGGESGKWIVQTLHDVRGGKKEDIRLLDVGSLGGTAYAKYPWIKAKSIDINPRGPDVEQVDFFHLPPPTSEEDRYDVVSLSMVINFVGDIQQRGRMLIHAHRYLKKGGHLALILPLACVANSRYCTHERLAAILDSCGWKVVHQNDSKSLTRYMLEEKSKKWDKKVWKKEEVKVGVHLNNFCIVVK